MSVFRTVASNTAFFSFAQILNPVTSILLISMIARSLGAEALGHYSLVLAIFYMAINLAGLGFGTPITRALAVEKHKAADYLIATGLVALISGAISILCVKALVAILDYPSEVGNATNILMWGVIPSVVILYLEAIFMAFQRVQFIAGLSLAENICKVAVGLTLLSMGKGIAGIFFAIVALRVIVLLAYLVFFPRYIAPISLRLKPYVLSELRRVSPVFTSNLLMQAVLGRLDLLILSKVASMADVGYYSAAFRFVEIARLVPRSFKRVALSPMSESYSTDQDNSKALFDKGIVYMAAYGAGATLAIFTLARPLITLLYGDGFQAAEPILRTLAFIVIPVALCNVLGAMLFAAHRESLDLLANAIRIVSLAVFCAAFYSLWGVQGIAVALVASHAILFALQWLFIHKYCFATNLLRRLERPALAALMAFTIPIVLPFGMEFLVATFALFAYALLLIALDPVLRGDIIGLVRAQSFGSKPSQP